VLRGGVSRPKAESSPIPIVSGFRMAGLHCGIKKAGEPDLALIVSDAPCAAAGVFTRSTVVGAPVELSRERIASGRAHAVVVNSGISNVAMGARGMRDARTMTRLVARGLGCAENDVLVASTGVIGEPLPMAALRSGIPAALDALSEDGLPDAARAIMTTDTHPKLASRRVKVGDAEVCVAGIAKGVGMCEPNMATMLAFILTDAAATPAFVKRVLKGAVGETLNRITVDGETSTSDTAVLLANGRAGNRSLRGPGSAGARAFARAVGEVCEELAKMLARDGEGATKLITVKVTGARDAADAERAARRIANSMLVKTAIFGRDANWGRILQTVGAGGVKLELRRTRVRLGGVTVFKGGTSAGPAARKRAEAKLAADEVEIEIHLGTGRASDRVWTCDLTYDYVRINAEYTT
jgi:glutamate N-acetyltransferase/amino-acid N-acetyltransferase